VRHLLHRFISDQSGVTGIEYALVASMVAIAIVASARLLGTNLSAKFAAIAGDFS